MLHRYNDGSVLRTMTAKELIDIPVWKGNRVLDAVHANAIKQAIGRDVRLLDSSNFSIVSYHETTASGESILQRYLIDGQHRASVIRDYYRTTVCEPDFTVTVREKSVESETEAVEYFNVLNNVKPQHWKTDPNQIVNKYIVALEKQFNTDKKSLLIRPTAKRPYLSSDKLRDEMLKNITGLKGTADDVAKFVAAAVNENKTVLTRLEMASLSATKDQQLIERALKAKFALAYETQLPWISKITAAVAAAPIN